MLRGVLPERAAKRGIRLSTRTVDVPSDEDTARHPGAPAERGAGAGAVEEGAFGNPLVSVVIPVRNRESTILRALASVAIQDYAPIEVIVIDDASDDATPDILASYTGLPLVVRRLPTQSGASAARNLGIEIARGDRKSVV
jgi:cellulose synthase/poly-beta-1,6-N-acetylglucosamine synthase-like glycosyltransferase